MLYNADDFESAGLLRWLRVRMDVYELHSEIRMASKFMQNDMKHPRVIADASG